MLVRRFSYRVCAGLLVVIALIIGTGRETALASDTVYRVRKNDNLTRIAATYGVTVTQLAVHNHIARNATIYVGQRLRIPSKDEPADSVLSKAVQHAIASAKVRKGRWKFIVIHHSGTTTGTVKGMDEYHRMHRHMENGLAYHFVIGNGRGMGDGEVAVGMRWTTQLNGGHLASESLNEIAIGICLVGNFDAERPTKKQLASLEALLQTLRKRCDLSAAAIRIHQQINPIYTRCPGKYFPVSTFTQPVKKRK